MSKINYTEGQKLGNLIFLNRVESLNKKRPIANFKCECGKEFVCRIESVKTLATKSCGCAKSRFVSESQMVHGHVLENKKTPEYLSWGAMRARCNNPKAHNYEKYKELGVTICKDWDSFSTFLADMGLKPSREYTIERVNNNKGYCKENCKWATKKEQQRNTRNTTFIEYKGVRKSTAEWNELLGFPLHTLYKRVMGRKWDLEKAFTTSLNGIPPKIINF